ncbi:HIRAN domain-containing protein [Bradyrhizobium paxllaeri]|uniref:HIRAN domain-containing protein n=1 Tax=Bradyrhizobium paxllaeri TaxID=190148 RepID=UPI000810C496|nr:HIRAN domain-containing protein [Bradyrhizobium paxllaeri]
MKSLYTLVGMKYRKADALVASLPQGAVLRLRRDRDNQHDPFAVAVYFGHDHVAFIKGTEVVQLARWMDQNNQDHLSARLTFDGSRWPHAEVDHDRTDQQ